MNRIWGVVAAGLAGTAVVLGAFAAHGLDGHFTKIYANVPAKMVAGEMKPASAKALADFKTGAEYQFLHAFGLFVVAYLMTNKPSRSLTVAAWSFLLGTLFFSGSLYLLTLLKLPLLGMVAPIGGTFFIVGWICLAVSISHRNTN